MSDDVRFGKFRFDRDAGVLYREAELVQVPPRALAVLDCLIAGRGDVVTKERILETAWPDSFVAEDSLTHAISVLRGALGDDPKKPEFIQTVPRRGYRFVAALPARGDVVADTGEKKRRAALPILAAAVIVAVATLWAGMTGRQGPAPAAGYERIQRLVLVIEAGDAVEIDTAATRDLLAERIERDTGLGVVAAAGEAGATLSVRFERIAGRLQITARVRDAAGQRWWGQRWNMPVELYADDLFAQSLLSRLQFLLDVVSANSTVRGASSREAMVKAVHAAELLLGDAQYDLHLADQAAADLRRAVDLDPEFMRARAGWIAVRAEAMEWRDWTTQEREDAERDIVLALEEEPADPLIHIAAALLAKLRGDLDRMRSELDAAVTLSPSLFWIYMIRAELEHQMGFDDLALTTATRGVAFDPYLPSMLGRLIDVHLWREDPDAAEETLSTLAAIDGEGGYWSGRSRARILLARGDLVGAEAQLLALREDWANALWIHAELATFYAQQGNAAAAEAATARLESLLRE